MSSVIYDAETAPASTKPPAQGRKKRWTRFLLPTYTFAAILYLMLPIFVMILYGFNKTAGSSQGIAPRVKSRWLGFTLDWYRQLFDIPDLTAALKNSLFVAFIAAILATILGTMIGMALARYRYRGKGTTDFVLFVNIASPEIVMGAALAGFFVSIGVSRGVFSLIATHTMFAIAFVAVTVRARMAGLDRSLENAAMDLGAGPFTTFQKVTFPLILPGIIAGGLLAFALSIDDFVITQFVQGSTSMFPTWVFAASRVGIPPQVNVMATIIFMVGAIFALINIGLQRKKAS